MSPRPAIRWKVWGIERGGGGMVVEEGKHEWVGMERIGEGGGSQAASPKFLTRRRRCCEEMNSVGHVA